jgi:diguanylate cyclase
VAGMPIIASANAVHVHGAHTRDDMALMFLLGFLLSYAILDAACRVRAAHGTHRTLWLLGGSLVVGLGIFSFHFVALLTVGLPMPFTADPVTFGVSAVTAVVAAAGALHHVNRGVATLPPFAVSAGLKGFALVATHYTSVAALHVPATIVYDPLLVFASVVLAVLVSAAGLALAGRLHAETPAFAALERALGAVVIALGLVAMHQVSARAGKFAPDPDWVVHASSNHLHRLAQAWLLPWLTAAGGAAVATLAIAATISRRNALRSRRRPAVDGLTGLGNGVLLRRRLVETLAVGVPCSLVVVRVLRFEHLRHRFGPRDAETLLVHLGRRLSGSARPQDVVACLGVGEYAVLVADGRADVAAQVAARIARRVADPIRIGDLQVVVPALVGAAPARPGDLAGDVLRNAQIAAARDAAGGADPVPEVPLPIGWPVAPRLAEEPPALAAAG